MFDIQKIKESADFIATAFPSLTPSISIQTGTGLSGNFNGIRIEGTISYGEIPHFVRSTAPSHAGNLIAASWNGVQILILDGRFHYYEGYSMQEVVYPILVLKALGYHTIVLTNASGSVSARVPAGSIVNITDHISLHHENPLRGLNDERLGPRFPSMSQAYDVTGGQILHACAEKLNITLKDGIYLGLPGPNFETPAEYRMAAILGADLIGMSTIPEVIAANYCGLKVNALSIVSNLFDPDQPSFQTSLEEVLEQVKATSSSLISLLEEAIPRLANI